MYLFLIIVRFASLEWFAKSAEIWKRFEQQYLANYWYQTAVVWGNIKTGGIVNVLFQFRTL